MQTREERNEASRLHMEKIRYPIYRERRAKLIALLGAKCSKCGLEYDGENGPQFSFHHEPGIGKGFNLSLSQMGKPYPVLKAELEKTTLLCLNCHSLEHAVKY